MFFKMGYNVLTYFFTSAMDAQRLFNANAVLPTYSRPTIFTC